MLILLSTNIYRALIICQAMFFMQLILLPLYFLNTKSYSYTESLVSFNTECITTLQAKHSNSNFHSTISDPFLFHNLSLFLIDQMLKKKRIFEKKRKKNQLSRNKFNQVCLKGIYEKKLQNIESINGKINHVNSQVNLYIQCDSN